MKASVKAVTFLLIAAMALGALSCAKPVEDIPASVTDGATSAEAETEAEVTATQVVSEMYAGVKFDGEELVILSPSPGGHFYNNVGAEANEIWYENYNGEIMNDAIVDRNRRAEELLDMKITANFGGTDTNTITTLIKNSVAAGSDDFDAVINRMDFLGTSMNSGCLLNLMAIGSIDPSHSWWDANIVNTFTLFNSKLYWISGDINTFDDYAAEVIFFNKKLCDDFNLEYPYESVVRGDWVIDDFFSMSKTVEEDINGDGKLVVNVDRIGHQEQNDHIKHWIYAMGEKSMDIDEEGSLEIMTLTERQIIAVNKLYECMVDGAMTYTGGAASFTADLALFQGDMLGAINTFRDMVSDFGIVPMPKLDEDQEKYGGYVSNGWTTALGIPITCTDTQFTGTALEVICGFSTDTVRSAMYDVLLASKLIRDEETVQTLEIALASKSYDWAVDFSWGSSFQSAYNGIYNTKNNNYVSAAEKVLKSQEKTLTKLLETIAGLEF